ncbi:RES family NAD+ phosphorylase [Levilactobacillus enshiensis]|uniref:RES family NAD+ phosphorylase n=1 Tax=Levilactobacillus enshiensis TaxID=2590213 RepID=UPI00117AD931|nr:RES family NAD+ phosphorylase [Levilactobacillus enshiensis]
MTDSNEKRWDRSEKVPDMNFLNSEKIPGMENRFYKASLGLPATATHREIQVAIAKRKPMFDMADKFHKASLGLPPTATQREVQEAIAKRKPMFDMADRARKLSLGLPPAATQLEVQEAIAKQKPMADFAKRNQRVMLGLPENASQADVQRAIEKRQHRLVEWIPKSSYGLSAKASGNKTVIGHSVLKGLTEEISKGYRLNPGWAGKVLVDDWKIPNKAKVDNSLFKLNKRMLVFESRKVRNSFAHGILTVDQLSTDVPALKNWLDDTNTANDSFVETVKTVVEKQPQKSELSESSISAEVEVAATQDLIKDSSGGKTALEVTSEELYEFQDLLSKSSLKAYDLPVAKRLRSYFSGFKVKRQKISIPLYHGRSRNIKKKPAPFVESELDSPALYGMPGAGRFNNANVNLYYTSDNVGALVSELKLERDEVYDAIEFEPDDEFGVIDLTMENPILMNFCLQRVASTSNVPVEYFIPMYITQCLRENRDVDVIKVRSAVAPDTINYIFLDISMRRDADLVKIYRSLGQSDK